MKTLTCHLTLLASLLLPGMNGAHALGLGELESIVRQSDPKTAIARLNTAAARARVQEREAASGWELFANANIGHTTETDPGGPTRNYQNLGYSVGISHPLFGSNTSRQQDIAAAGLQNAQAIWNEQLVYRQSLLELRQDYISLWQVEQFRQLAQAFLSQQAYAQDLLAKRRAEGLLLPSDEQTFDAQFNDVSTRAGNAAAQAVLLQQRLAARTGLPAEHFRQLDAAPDSIADSHPLPEPEQHPLAMRAAEQLQYQQHLVQSNKTAGVESSVYLSYSGLQKGTQGNTPNHDWQLGVQVRAPLTIGRLQNAVQERLLAELDSSARNYEQALLQLRLDYQQNRADYHAAHADVASSNLFRLAAARALQEKQLRRSSLPGDVEEQWLAARFDYFQKASQQLANLKRQQASVAALAYHDPQQRDSVSPGLPLLAAPLGAIQPVSRAPDSPRTGIRFALPTGVYLWDSRRALANPAGAMRAWQQYGVSRVLVGLTAAQLRSPQLHERFRNLATAADAAHIKLELLLGDAHWISPAGRGQLLSLLEPLHTLPVSGLNLDLEIEQLPDWQARQDSLTRDWLATLRAAANAVPWPLAATFHHRHLDNPLVSSGLSQSSVQRADIMAFSTSPATVLAIAGKARQQLGGLPFNIVQSVETRLSDQESYARKGIAPLQSLAGQLRQQGSAGLLLQDWPQLQRMRK